MTQTKSHTHVDAHIAIAIPCLSAMTNRDECVAMIAIGATAAAAAPATGAIVAINESTVAIVTESIVVSVSHGRSIATIWMTLL